MIYTSIIPLVLALAPAASVDDSVPSATAVVLASKQGAARQSTAVLVDSDQRWLLASLHAVQGYSEFSVLFPLIEDDRLVTAPAAYQERLRKGLAIKGRLIATDARRDLALLELESLPPKASAIALATAPPPVRSSVILIGNPTARNVLWERVAALVMRTGKRQWTYDDGRQIDTTALEVSVEAALTGGYSGGPVLNRKRQLAAVIAAEKQPGSTRIYCTDVIAIRALLLETRLRNLAVWGLAVPFR